MVALIAILNFPPLFFVFLSRNWPERVLDIDSKEYETTGWGHAFLNPDVHGGDTQRWTISSEGRSILNSFCNDLKYQERSVGCSKADGQKVVSNIGMYGTDPVFGLKASAKEMQSVYLHFKHPNILHTSDELLRLNRPQRKIDAESLSEVRKILGCLKCKYADCIFIRQRLIRNNKASANENAISIFAF